MHNVIYWETQLSRTLKGTLNRVEHFYTHQYDNFKRRMSEHFKHYIKGRAERSREAKKILMC